MKNIAQSEQKYVISYEIFPNSQSRPFLVTGFTGTAAVIV
jgi:hypothetical protein